MHKTEHYYLVLPARNREHAEALLEDLQRLSKRIGWPKPIVCRAVADPTLPPDAPPVAETETWKEAT